MNEHGEKLLKACDDFMKELDKTLRFTKFTKWLSNKLNNMLN